MIPVRFHHATDELLRDGVRGHGDISRRVIEALEGVKWETVKVQERTRNPHKNPEGKDLYVATTVRIPTPLYRSVCKAAANRDISAAMLIDACVLKFYKKPQKKPAAAKPLET